MRSLVSLVTLLGLAAAAAAADLKSSQPLSLGSKAPDFKLPGVDGRKHSLKDFARAKVLVIVFTCNHCPTAQFYEERLIKLVADYQSKGVALVAISPNDPESVRLNELGYTDLSDSFEEMKIRAQDRKFNFPYLYDGEDQKVSRAYGPTATPHAFVFDRQRRLRYVGRIDDSERPEYVKIHDLRNALDALLKGGEPEITQTRAFGCSIKWAGKSEDVKKYMEKLAALPVSVEPVDAEGLKALRKNDSGKLRLVNFWATWCGPCVAEFPSLVEIHRMYGHRAFELVTVAGNFPDEKKEVLAFLQKQQAAMKNLIFGTTDKYKLIEAFDQTWRGSLPYTVLISPEGEVLYRHTGEIDALELKQMIVKSLKYDRKQ